MCYRRGKGQILRPRRLPQKPPPGRPALGDKAKKLRLLPAAPKRAGLHHPSAPLAHLGNSWRSQGRRRNRPPRKNTHVVREEDTGGFPNPGNKTAAKGAPSTDARLRRVYYCVGIQANQKKLAARLKHRDMGSRNTSPEIREAPRLKYRTSPLFTPLKPKSPSTLSPYSVAVPVEREELPSIC